MTTILLHTAKAITPTAEILDAGILIRDGVIEAVGARADVSLPAGAIEVKVPTRGLTVRTRSGYYAQP